MNGITYPFLPQLPFIRSEYKWKETTIPSPVQIMALSSFPWFYSSLQNRAINTPRRYNCGKHPPPVQQFCGSQNSVFDIYTSLYLTTVPLLALTVAPGKTF